MVKALVRIVCKLLGHKWGKWYYCNPLGERWRFCVRCGTREDQKADFHGEYKTIRVIKSG